jgi:hypothetical protein
MDALCDYTIPISRYLTEMLMTFEAVYYGNFQFLKPSYTKGILFNIHLRIFSMEKIFLSFFC